MELAGLLFILGASVPAIFAVWLAYWGSASAHWPTVPGEVIGLSAETPNEHLGLELVAEIVFEAVTDTTVVSGSSSVKHLNYRYVVNDRTYKGNRVSYGGWQGLEPHKRWAEQYPHGTAVTVAYDPDEPERAVLEPGWHRGTIAGSAGAAAMMLLIGLLLR